MVSTIQLRLFIWAVILVSIGQIYLIVRYIFWPRLSCVIHCSWCWQDVGIPNEYPAPWSSTICPYHDRRVRAQARVRRLTRHLPTASTTKPATVILQEKEVQV